MTFAFALGSLLPLGTDSLVRIGMRLKPISQEERVRKMASIMGVKVDRVYLREGKGINAYSLGGLRNVLILERESMNLPDDQFRAMVAHELAHIKMKHTLKRSIVLAVGLSVVAALSLIDKLLLPSFLLVFLFDMEISKRMEKEADAEATRFVDPKALISLISKYGEVGPLSDHPSAEDRMRAIERVTGGP